ncbi:MAG: hypothetical protein B7Y69_11090 [Sphingobacteriia bacterium 35-40-8]|nr:MAG: hypothetical protein B7Y69_11090 [Sphingobacteriia bacterium 35-40-8]HQR94853.1 Wzz/FepE/Etk N-terminal domain-containing protein [Sediminibacterium sp.]
MTENYITEDPAFSLKGTLASWRSSLAFLLKNWKQLLMAAIAGGLLGLGYFWFTKPSYTARLTFVVEEAKQSGGGVLSALAGQFGVDIGGMSGTSGVLAGDNVQELLKSRFLLKKVLLSKSPLDSSHSVAEDYAIAYGWLAKWAKKSGIGPQNASFPLGAKSLSRVQDSLLQVIMKEILEKELAVSKPDKKLGFFELNVTNKQELLSQSICLQLIKEATVFYIDTKTRRLKINVERLQRKSDSLEYLLNRKTISTLSANRDLLNVNPAFTTAGADLEISNRDKVILSTIYAEVVKNLEISKTALIQETPTVQLVDQPELPLKKNKMEWWVTLGLGVIISIISASGYLFIKYDK